MSGVGMGLSAIGSIIGFGGAMQAASSAKHLAKLNANLINWEGKLEEVRHRREARMLVGAQVSGYAKGGVLTTEGTAADVIRDTSIKAESDALAIKHSTWLRQHIVKKGGQAQARAITFGAVANLFGGAADIYGMKK